MLLKYIAVVDKSNIIIMTYNTAKVRLVCFWNNFFHNKLLHRFAF